MEKKNLLVTALAFAFAILLLAVTKPDLAIDLFSSLERATNILGGNMS